MSSQPTKLDDTGDVNKVGNTAFLVNSMRAEEKNSPKPLYYDNFSQLFVENQLQTGIDTVTDRTWFADETWHKAMLMGARTFFIDECLRKAFMEGTRQVVILGSGLDCRPLRLYHPDIHFIEVDETPVLDYKVKKLQQAGYPTHPSVLIRGNYLEIDLFGELAKAGLDASKQVLFVWEGNTMYLPPSRCKSLLKELLTRFPQSTLVFDYNLAPMADASGPHFGDPEEEKKYQTMMDAVTDGQWVWIGRFDPEEYQRDLQYEVLESHSIWGIMRKYRGALLDEIISKSPGAMGGPFIRNMFDTAYFINVVRPGGRSKL